LSVIGRKVGFAAYGTGRYNHLPKKLIWPQECAPNKKIKTSVDIEDWRCYGIRGGLYN
jgi:hypothetical protein